MRSSMLAVLGLVACGGGSYCDRAADAAKDCEEQFDDADLAACEEALDKCSNEDQKILDDVIDCLDREGLLGCDTETGTTGTGMEDFAAFLACYAPTTGLSAECAAGMATGSTTFSTSM